MVRIGHKEGTLDRSTEPLGVLEPQESGSRVKDQSVQSVHRVKTGEEPVKDGGKNQTESY